MARYKKNGSISTWLPLKFIDELKELAEKQRITPSKLLANYIQTGFNNEEQKETHKSLFSELTEVKTETKAYSYCVKCQKVVRVYPIQHNHYQCSECQTITHNRLFKDRDCNVELMSGS